jgi:hypothetical protein
MKRNCKSTVMQLVTRWRIVRRNSEAELAGGTPREEGQ